MPPAPTPTVDQVAAFMVGRIKDDVGEVPVFTAATSPTATEVAGFIVEASDEILAQVGIDIPDAPGDDPDRLRKAVTRLIARRAALEAELSRWPNQADTAGGGYDRQKTLYDERLKAVVDAVQDARAGGDPGQVDDRTSPVGVFPDPEVRWDMEAF